uniref:Rho-GAP domain-containing protein n=1 Tax=Octactis speculum TaxID=3111310 RepID=A0A7S2BX88_9STRA|mmetsp:Transcript_28497/g.38914  ORF Transcript_28497/g.38914 Transcript_28497/m.38914 type:complete len:177 (+) Transcript_28497:82-612(+)
MMDLDNDSTAVCLSYLIKLWIRNRKPSLLGTSIPHSAINEVAEMVRSEEMIMGGQRSSLTTAAADQPAEDRAGSLIGQLPSCSRSILLWTLDLLVQVLDESSKNKQSAHALSRIFAPTLYNENELFVDGTNGWPSNLEHLRFVKNMTKFTMCAINWRRRLTSQFRKNSGKDRIVSY